MTTAREIMLNRSKAPAKIHSMERPGGPAGSPGVELLGAPTGLQAGGSRPGSGPSAVQRPPKAPAPRPSGGSVRTPGRQASPAGSASARRPSEGRRPGAEPPGGARRTPSEPPRRCGAPDRATPTPPRAKARAASVPRRVKVGDAPPPVERKGVGKVPEYLRKRQEEMAEEKRIAERPVSPQPPPGFRKVQDDEKQATLATLRQRKAETEKAQQALPLKIESMGQKQREKDLSDRIAHIEKLIGMINKPVVFMPADAAPIATSIPPLGPEATPGPSPEARAGPTRPAAERCHVDTPWDRGGAPQPRTEVKVVQAPGGASSLNLGWG